GQHRERNATAISGSKSRSGITLAAEGPVVWGQNGCMTLDLTAYFDRIGFGGPAEPTLDVLQALVTAHTRTIPFENLDPVLGVPVDDLGPQALIDKLVHRRRGGYCYEQNGLFGYVLAEIGFRVRRLGGRVIWMRAPDAPQPAQ